MNELLFFITLLINFVCIIGSYWVFGKTGLYCWVTFATVLANIEVVKSVDVFGMALTLGNITYATTFLATDILSEKYGARDARKAVYIGFASMVMFTILTQIDLLYVPNENDFANEAMNTLFSLTPRLCLASMVGYLISNLLDTYVFEILRLKYKGLWVRNNFSTFISQFVDTLIFTGVAFVGVFPLEVLFELFVTTYLIKLLISVCDTPFLYLAVRGKNDSYEKGTGQTPMRN